MSGIRIDALDSAAAALMAHVVPAMNGGKTVKLTVQQILDLVIGGSGSSRDTLKEISDALDAGLQQKLDVLQPFIDIASAATTNLGAQASQNLRVTGTTTITSFGSAPAGTFRNLRFAGALTLTHNATSMILPNGGANIAIAAGDIIDAVSLGSGNWVVTNYQRAASGTAGALAILQDQKASGTSGGATVATTWTTRAINTKVSDPSSIATLSSNTIVTTVDCAIDIDAMFFVANSVMLRIWNVTDSVEAFRGVSSYAGSGASASFVASCSGRLTAGKTYRVEYWAQTARATDGLGVAATTGAAEVFLTATLRALS